MLREFAGFTRRAVCAAALAAAFSFVSPIHEADAQEEVTVRMDWVISGYHAPFFVGVKNGYYEEEGLDVTVEPGNGSGNVAQAIGAGNGDFATVDGGTMMQLVAKGLPVKAVMGWFQRNPIGIIYNVASGIKEPADLTGKTLVVTNGDAPSALLPAFAKATGIDIQKANVISTDPASKNAAVISGRADAVVTFSFLAIPIIESAGIEADSLDYADYGVNVPGLSVIARDDYVEANPETVKKFVRATRKAMEWTREHPAEAIEIMIELNPGQKIITDTALPVLEGSFQLLETENTAGLPLGVMSEADWASAEQLLAEYVGMEKGESPSRYFTNDFTQE